MPQIDAPTVAEHRAQQREALLDAAEQILLEEGHAALTFGRLGERTALARNSIYRYFGSRDDLIAALCERDMPRWLEDLRAAMDAAPDADARIEAYVATQLRLIVAGAHRLAQLLGDAPLGPAVRARINALAYRPAALLVDELKLKGDPDAELAAQLVQGVVNAGVRLLHSRSIHEVEPLTVSLAQTLVRSPRRHVTGFADLPVRISALAAEHERLGVVLLDAFGWAFVQRHADHPFLRRLEITQISSQFPSTTTAHLTTLYCGLPVTEHGLYEWRCYEPLVGEVIRPLRFALADSDDPLPITPRELFPWPSTLAGATALQPAPIADTPYGSAALAGATILPFATIEEGVALLDRPGLTYLYWDAIDATGHREGPSSDAFVAASLRALDALASVKTPLLVTADHGQIDVDRTDNLDLFWSELPRHLTRQPAGSARDLFLHVDDPDLVVAELSERLGDRARVCRAEALFDPIGPRLAERLADVCVLPAPGRMVGLTGFPSPERRFKGHHGGLTPEEAETWIGFQA